MNKVLFSILGLFFLSLANAQIETDRPDFTESPNVVPKGALQIETGFIWEKDQELIPGGGATALYLKETNITINTTLLRFGLTNNIELRLNMSYDKNEIDNPLAINQLAKPITQGFRTSFIGFKTNLYKNEKLSVGFLGHLYIPELASGDFSKSDGQKVAPEFLIPCSVDVTDRFGVAFQYGLTWDGFTANPTTSYTLALGYSLTEKLSFYIEPYGFLTNNGDELHLMNGGFTYLVNDDFQLDLTGGFGLNDDAPNNFLNCGASVLLFNK